MNFRFNPINLIAWITAVLVAGLALAALGISYGNLFTLADAKHFAMLPANLWAVVIDGFIVVATLAVLRTSLQKEPAWYPWLLVGLTTAMSVVFNVWHAADLLEGFMRAIPPIALFLSFHLLMQQIEALIQRRAITLSLEDMQRQVADKAQELADLQAQIAAKEATDEAKAQTRQAKLADIETAIKDRRKELKDIQQQIEDAKKQFEDILGEMQYASADRPDRITERRDIARWLASKGVLPIDIATYFQVSQKTIERDLAAQENNKNGHQP